MWPRTKEQDDANRLRASNCRQERIAVNWKDEKDRNTKSVHKYKVSMRKKMFECKRMDIYTSET